MSIQIEPALAITFIGVQAVGAMVATAVVAESRKRNPFAWALLGLIFGIVALCAVGFLPPRGEDDDRLPETLRIERELMQLRGERGDSPT